MSYIIDFLKKILLKHDIEIAEFQSILAKSLCGILLIFGTPAHTVGYNTLSKAINIYVLGVVLSSVAFIYFFGLVKGNRRIRSVTSFISCIIWAFITVATAFKHDLLMVLSFTFALSSALIYLRVRRGNDMLSRSDHERLSTIPSINIERPHSLPTRESD